MTTPATPNAVSPRRMASRISQACESVWPPTMREFVRYSSLWMTTRKTSEAMAIAGEMPRERITITVFEIRLPRTGIRPQTNVTKTMVVAKGMCCPNSGSATST